MSKTGLNGNLKTMSLADFLQWAGSGRKVGTLRLRSDALEKKIYFQDGAIIGSSSNDPREYLGQFMLSEGIITEQQLKDAFDLVRARVSMPVRAGIPCASRQAPRLAPAP
jgi:hypothetical protein